MTTLAKSLTILRSHKMQKKWVRQCIGIGLGNTAVLKSSTLEEAPFGDSCRILTPRKVIRPRFD